MTLIVTDTAGNPSTAASASVNVTAPSGMLNRASVPVRQEKSGKHLKK